MLTINVPAFDLRAAGVAVAATQDQLCRAGDDESAGPGDVGRERLRPAQDRSCRWR